MGFKVASRDLKKRERGSTRIIDQFKCQGYPVTICDRIQKTPDTRGHEVDAPVQSFSVLQGKRSGTPPAPWGHLESMVGGRGVSAYPMLQWRDSRGRFQNRAQASNDILAFKPIKGALSGARLVPYT